MSPSLSSRARNALRQPRLPKLVIGPGALCAGCDHPRSSHSVLVLSAHCKAEDCTCPVFESFCGCGHLIIDHSHSCPPDPWACARCKCSHFGPAPDQVLQAQLSSANYQG